MSSKSNKSKETSGKTAFQFMDDLPNSNSSGPTFGQVPKKNPCFDFVNGKCTRNPCPYSHDKDIVPSKKPCFDFANGKCTRNPCIYFHDESMKSAGSGSGKNNSWRDKSRDFSNQRTNRNSANNSNSNSNSYYKSHLSFAEVEAGVSTGKYLVGSLYVNPRKCTEGYVRSIQTQWKWNANANVADDSDSDADTNANAASEKTTNTNTNTTGNISIDIRVDDDKLRNRSLHLDLVAIEILPEDDWVPWSAMMGEKLGLNDINSGSMDDSGIGSGIRTRSIREADVIKSLWAPQQEMINAFTVAKAAKAQSEIDNSSNKTHPIELRSKLLGLQPRARVVSIIESKHQKQHVGSLALMNAPEQGKRLSDDVKGCYFTPSDNRFNKIYVPRLALPESFQENPYDSIKEIFIVDIQSSWSANSRLPQGENVRSIGEFGNINTETKALLIENSCDHEPYTEDAIEPLKAILSEYGVNTTDGANPSTSTSTSTGGNGSVEGWVIPEYEILKRKDLRNSRIFTIDPPNAKDLDDALHITPLNDGTDRYELGVHIADVAHFLQPGTSLDEEAQKRSTSVYLVQKVIPMLPSILCEQLCSLNPNVDRLAFSCIWIMNSDGTIDENTKPWFGKTVINSCAKLDYGTAQRILDREIAIPSSGSDSGSGSGSDSNLDNIDDKLLNLTENLWEKVRRPNRPDIKSINCANVINDIMLMGKLAKQRRLQRLNNGALVLTTSKLTFKLDSLGNPEILGTYPMRDSNHLVEEYMLLANYLVAQELLLKYGKNGFIRNHGNPDQTGLDELQNTFQILGYQLDITSSTTIQTCLNNITRNVNNKTTLAIISNLLQKPIPRAMYMRAGDDPLHWKHYALSIPYYTHFTSPIRRYADVMVHRLLLGSIDAMNTTSTSNSDNNNIDSNNSSNDGNSHSDIEQILLLQTVKKMENQCKNSFDDIATQCNEMKDKSKMAQQRSDRVFFSIYLKNKPIDNILGYVVGIGEKSFTVFIPEYGIEDRLFVDNMPGVTSQWQSENKTLILYRQNTTNQFINNETETEKEKEEVVEAVAIVKSNIPNKLQFIGAFPLKILTPIKVYLSAKMSPPIDVCISLIGPDTNTDNHLVV
jgi:DIS3-like exonuclease 2